MTEEEIRQRVGEILLKRDLGDHLTSQEETILAYTLTTQRASRQ
jgi:hypothetical protein